MSTDTTSLGKTARHRLILEAQSVTDILTNRVAANQSDSNFSLLFHLNSKHAMKMSSQPFRWRTVVEFAVISVVIYVLIGTPGLPNSLPSSSSDEKDVPIARAKVESLVYTDENLQCSEHAFDVHIFSQSPLVIYIDGFVSEGEARHLVDIRYATSYASTINVAKMKN